MNKKTVMNLCAATLTAMTLASTMTACSSTATRRDAPEYAEDAVISTKVKAVIAKDTSIHNAADVQIETYRGIVQLSGFVDSDNAAMEAVKAARSVDGVKSVKNDLRIKPAP